MNFDPLLKDKQLLMSKKCFNKIYAEFNFECNDEIIIFYFLKSMDFCLVKGRIFDF
jgi:hypothetical protein